MINMSDAIEVNTREASNLACELRELANAFSIIGNKPVAAKLWAIATDIVGHAGNVEQNWRSMLYASVDADQKAFVATIQSALPGKPY